jgi:HAD superfamily hydrolase (TIGR01544 family)
MNKLEIIKNSKPEDLTVVLDFDRTLTYGNVDGVEVTSIIAVLREENYIDEDYVKETKALFAHYRPLEIDPNLSKQEKSNLMQEWWQKHLNLLTAKGFTKNDVYQVVLSRLLQLRHGVKDFLQTLNDRNIKTIILSSGIPGYDGILGVLQREGCDYPNIEIISNKITWNESGVASGYVEPVIHSINKTGFLTKEKLTKNIVVIGDNLHDADVVLDAPNHTVFRIGIYENKDLSNLEHYQKTFDMVMINEKIDFEEIKAIFCS